MESSWLVPTLKEAYKNRAEISGLFQRLWNHVFGVKASVGFTGMEGVGKSVLFDFLTGDGFKPGYTPPGFSDTEDHGRAEPYREGRVFIRVAPGHTSPQRGRSLTDLFSPKGKKATPVDGVVHVVANGFARLRTPLARQTWEEEGISLSGYRERQRARELADWQETAREIVRSHRQRSGKPRFLLVVVGQVDLYEQSMQEAYRYYGGAEPGTFGAELARFHSDVGLENLSIDVLPVCTWLEDFQWRGTQVPSTQKPFQRDHYIIQLIRRLEKLAIDSASQQ